MNISGFSFARNAHKLNYPFREAILSVLPVCDEFIIAVGEGDADDQTRALVAAIGSPKIRIIDTRWDDLARLGGHIYSQQTNIALRECRGDWCFYIQCDEVLHERYLDAVVEQCRRYRDDRAVEGFLFNYKHFWADYDHYLISHKWYPKEIRIVRNGIGIESIGDAQSFRRNGHKLAVIQLQAEMFHYGYVRHPSLMQRRTIAIETNYWGAERTRQKFRNQNPLYDYGSLERIPRYTGTYPAVMRQFIATMDWKHLLQYSGKSTVRHVHDRFKVRLLTWIEQKIFLGSWKQPWGYKNYRLLRR